MKLTVIAAGKMKERFLEEGIREYQKRIAAFGELTVIEVEDEKAPETLSEKELQQVLRREGERILSKLPKQSVVVALDVRGKRMSSEDLAAYFQTQANAGQGRITFIIGGSNGLSPEVLQAADLRLSFSDFTFPHRLMRLILAEQLYRALTIVHGRSYHK